MKSTNTNLTPPKVGKPLTKSWVDAVTQNMNKECLQAGAYSDGPVSHSSLPSPYINPLMLRVKNMTGVPLDMFSVLQITTPEVTNEAAFPHILRSQQNEIFGVTPSSDGCDPKIVVTSYYADPETVLPCVVSGPTPVRVLYNDAESLTYPFAGFIDGDHTKLVASPFGKIRILWHAEPEVPQSGCDPRVLWSWVNLGSEGEWVFCKLQEDLKSCSSAVALMTDECGNQLGECPILRTVWAPEGNNLCQCQTAVTIWKAGEVVPIWWYEYLCKWVTIPNPAANVVPVTMDVVTDIEIEGIEWTPTGECRNVLIDVELDETKISLVSEPVEIEISGTGSTESEITVSGNVSLPVLQSIDISGTCAIDGEAPVEVSGDIELTFTEGETIDAIAEVSYTSPKISCTPTTIPTISHATFSGGFTGSSQKEVVLTASIPDDAEITTEKTIEYVPPHTSAYVTDVTLSSLPYQRAESVDISSVSGSVDLSELVETKTIVTNFSVSEDGCTINWETEEVQVLKGGVDLSAVPISLSGAASINSIQSFISVADHLNVYRKTLDTATASVQEFNKENFLSSLQLSGSVQMPTGVSGTVTLHNGEPISAISAIEMTGGEVTTTPVSITLPGIGTSTQTVSLRGEADLGGGSYSLSGLTAEVNTRAEGQVELTGAVSADIQISAGSVNVPTSIQIEEGGVKRFFECIPIYNMEGGTTNLVKEKVKMLTCLGCAEEEE